jgi:hypothetical protein
LPGAALIDWLPLAIPQSPTATYYAFEPKQLRDLYESADDFAQSRHWLNSRGQIAQMHRLCREAGARFILVFAPTKAHVIVPVVADRLPAQNVLDFTALSYRGDLPEPATFLQTLLERIPARESVVREWCQGESISFLTLTDALRDAAIAGEQVYYTYDQHWTPVGHDVVAQTACRSLGRSCEPSN